eukprot:g29505.t1
MNPAGRSPLRRLDRESAGFEDPLLGLFHKTEHDGSAADQNNLFDDDAELVDRNDAEVDDVRSSAVHKQDAVDQIYHASSSSSPTSKPFAQVTQRHSITSISSLVRAPSQFLPKSPSLLVKKPSKSHSITSLTSSLSPSTNKSYSRTTSLSHHSPPSSTSSDEHDEDQMGEDGVLIEYEEAEPASMKKRTKKVIKKPIVSRRASEQLQPGSSVVSTPATYNPQNTSNIFGGPMPQPNKENKSKKPMDPSLKKNLFEDDDNDSAAGPGDPNDARLDNLDGGEDMDLAPNVHAIRKKLRKHQETVDRLASARHKDSAEKDSEKASQEKEEELADEQRKRSGILSQPVLEVLITQEENIIGLRGALDELRRDAQNWAAQTQDWINQSRQQFEVVQSNQRKTDSLNSNKYVKDLEEEVAEARKLRAEVNQERLFRKEMEERHQESLLQRRKLLLQLQRLRGNIRVLCRVRPQKRGEETCIVPDTRGNLVHAMASSGRNQEFEFNRVLGPDSRQDQVFAEVQDSVCSVLDGYNACVFAYGQTGAGKTFTMEGGPDADDRGVTFRSIESIFDQMQNRANDFDFEVSLSAIEIYNEQVRNLLPSKMLPPPTPQESKDSKKGRNIPEMPVFSSQQTLDALRIAMEQRFTGGTAMNAQSSRSHCVVTVRVLAENKTTGTVYRGKLHLVDLAGSENVGRSEAQGDRLREAQNINRSLSALGDVFLALSKKQTHVPYRNSKLTHFLQDSLGGDSNSLMIVCISPERPCVAESINSLNFAVRVNSVIREKAQQHRQGSKGR